MQMPPIEPEIPTLPDETNPGPVPPMGPEPIAPDPDTSPLPDDDPGHAPVLPPMRDPFPDDGRTPSP